VQKCSLFGPVKKELEWRFWLHWVFDSNFKLKMNRYLNSDQVMNATNGRYIIGNPKRMINVRRGVFILSALIFVLARGKMGSFRKNGNARHGVVGIEYARLSCVKQEMISRNPVNIARGKKGSIPQNPNSYDFSKTQELKYFVIGENILTLVGKSDFQCECTAIHNNFIYMLGS
jgi:hypothetical protein